MKISNIRYLRIWIYYNGKENYCSNINNKCEILIGGFESIIKFLAYSLRRRHVNLPEKDEFKYLTYEIPFQ